MAFFVSSHFPGSRTLLETRYLEGWVDGWEAVTPLPATTPTSLARWRSEGVLQVLEKRLVRVTDSDSLRIARCGDPETQAHWLKAAILCDRVDDLFRPSET
ncbi:hypothetical protein ABZ490_10490 [Streptomyces sp. NPDC005811]|uniref:hypothetical protein n=1 Tax=Streptomyces sp. NPDC005811 TaxID=3154565 RepID=UPI0033C0A8FA